MPTYVLNGLNCNKIHIDTISIKSCMAYFKSMKTFDGNSKFSYTQ